MADYTTIYNEILNVPKVDFDALALKLFKIQSENCLPYKQFLTHISIEPENVTKIDQIPFLPIQLWKNHEIITCKFLPEIIFESSGTSGQQTSKHHLKSLDFYRKVCDLCFEFSYASSSDYCWLGLLPSYLERSNASLVTMVDHFIDSSQYSQSGFFLDDFEKLSKLLRDNEFQKIPTILIGVSFGLLDFIESSIWKKNKIVLNHTFIIETGGMKGRREELTKYELHAILKEAFSVDNIHSEYGMTELLSQSYSKGNGVFTPGPTQKIIIGDITDPLFNLENGKRGTIKIIDLANFDTCSFIATEDIGIGYEDDTFEVLGRLDISDIRGCSLMTA